MGTVLVLFTRDLRIRDHPALAKASRIAKYVVPAFVIDKRLLATNFVSPNRLAFLLDSLADLDRSLARLGARLVMRRGNVVDEAVRLAQTAGAKAIFASADVSAYARRREERLRAACAKVGVDLQLFPGVTVASPGALRPSSGGDHFRVFTPYWHRWRTAALRPLSFTPSRLALPPGFARRRIPRLAQLTRGRPSPDLPPGGETAGRAALSRWLRGDLAQYATRHDALAEDATSRLSPYVHFGCISAREIVARSLGRAGADAFVRQLCWRDFYHQVTLAFPPIARADYRPRGDRWRVDRRALDAWKAGRTGYPIVDAAMRQLAREGFMHNRARLIAASFLVKDLGVDWRRGAEHFLDLLVDGDIANNSGNWQWVAGTGNDTRPNRVFNPIAQAKRFDPEGVYVRRYVPELAAIRDGRVHEPWRLDPKTRRMLHYPKPITDHARAATRFLARRRAANARRR